MHAFACCDGNTEWGDGGADLLEDGQILRGYRLFKPAWGEACQFIDQCNCRWGIETSMHLNENIHIGSNGGTHRFDQLNGLVFLFAVQLVEASAEGIYFQ